jgi:two-component system LytT family response regulator
MTDERSPLRVAIVDDENLARLVVREYLSAMPGVEIVAECANGFEAVKAVAELHPDLLLLDVQMPKLDGFERGERAPARVLGEAARPAHAYTERILIRDGSRVHVIPVAAIDYVQAQDDYVSFRCGEKAYLKEQTLADVEASLDPARFVRIHRSYLLHLERLSRVELDARENRIAVLTGGARLPVSRAGYGRLTAQLGE